MTTIVKGHCATWTIKEQEGKYYVLCKDGSKRAYSTKEKAHWAIRVAEKRYLEVNPDTPVANQDIWADHNVLWVSDFDGNYYN